MNLLFDLSKKNLDFLRMQRYKNDQGTYAIKIFNSAKSKNPLKSVNNQIYITVRRTGFESTSCDHMTCALLFIKLI